MSDELFPAETVAMDSPRLAWMKRYGIQSHFAPHMTEAPWCVWLPANATGVNGDGIPRIPDDCGYGETEGDALTDLARKHGLKLWNEETA